MNDANNVGMKENSNAQQCLNWLIDEILGEDWYVVDPLSSIDQVNQIATIEILNKVKKKDWRMRRFFSTFDLIDTVINN